MRKWGWVWKLGLVLLIIVALETKRNGRWWYWWGKEWNEGVALIVVDSREGELRLEKLWPNLNIRSVRVLDKEAKIWKPEEGILELGDTVGRLVGENKWSELSEVVFVNFGWWPEVVVDGQWVGSEWWWERWWRERMAVSREVDDQKWVVGFGGGMGTVVIHNQTKYPKFGEIWGEGLRKMGIRVLAVEYEGGRGGEEGCRVSLSKNIWKDWQKTYNGKIFQQVFADCEWTEVEGDKIDVWLGPKMADMLKFDDYVGTF